MFEQLIGHKLGRYRINSLVGEGGMGSVLRGFDEMLQRDVAIKILAPQFTRQPNFRERFLQEARTAARLRHPGIVQVYDFGQAPSLLYIVMEFISGDDLRELLRRLNTQDQQIILSEAILLVQEISDAVDYAHRRGVLHRDIKPGNVMLRDEPSKRLPYQPILTDLGLAKLAEGGVITQVGTSMGTPTYMSPEQALGDKTDARSDVYSLGILMYELAVGKPPFKVRSITEAIRYHTKEPPPPPTTMRAEIPRALETVILKSLEKNPDNRYQDAGMLAKKLGETLSSMASRDEPPTPIPASVSLFTLYQPGEEIDAQQRAGVSTAAEGMPPQRSPDQLVVLMSDQTTKVINLKPDVFTIGREPGSDLVITERKVSRHHVRIEFDGAHYRITDLNSTNGSFLNDLKLLPDVPEVWTAGGVLRVGDAWIKLERGHEISMPASMAADRQRFEPLMKQTRAGAGQVGIFIESDQLSISPGDKQELQITLFNQGRLVDRFECSIVGIPADWIETLPEPVHLMPAEQKSVVMSIHPPHSPGSRAGQHVATIRVASQADPSQVAELSMTIEMASFQRFSLELRPRRQTDISSAKYKAIVENSGNSDLIVNMEALGHEDTVIFAFDKHQLRVPPGEQASAALTVRSTVPLIGDQERLHFFTITAKPLLTPELAQKAQGEWEQGVPSFEISLEPERQQGAFSGIYAITLSNLGNSDIEIQLDVKDHAASCNYSIEPRTILVPAAREALSELTVKPKAPLSGETSRQHNFAVSARPSEAPGSVRQVEGEWEQIPPTYSADLYPQSQSGSTSADYIIRIANHGDAPLTIHFEAADPNGACQFSFGRQALEIAPASRGEMNLQVTPKKALTSDAAATHPFTVTVYPSEAPASSRQMAGEFKQEPPVFEIKLNPAQIESRNKGVTQVEIKNSSDSFLNVRLEAAEPNSICLFEFSPPQVRIPKGQIRSATMTVRAKAKLEGNEAVMHDITVAGSAVEAPATKQSGQFQWVHLPGGRTSVLSIMLLLIAWFVTIFGWALGWGIITGLVNSEAVLREPFFLLVDNGLPYEYVIAIIVGIYSALGGAVGGFVTGLALKFTESSVRWIQVLLVAFGWILAFWVGGTVSTFTPIFMVTQFIFGLLITVIGALTMILVLGRTQLKFRWWQGILLLIGWLLAWFLAAGIPDFSVRTTEELVSATGLADPIGFLFAMGVIMGSVYGLVGGAVSLGLITWSQRELE